MPALAGQRYRLVDEGGRQRARIVERGDVVDRGGQGGGTFEEHSQLVAEGFGVVHPGLAGRVNEQAQHGLFVREDHGAGGWGGGGQLDRGIVEGTAAERRGRGGVAEQGEQSLPG